MKSFFLKIQAWLQRHWRMLAAALAALIVVAAIWTGVTMLIPILVKLPLFFFWVLYIATTVGATILSVNCAMVPIDLYEGEYQAA
jgi:hypothetical protein